MIQMTWRFLMTTENLIAILNAPVILGGFMLIESIICKNRTKKDHKRFTTLDTSIKNLNNNLAILQESVAGLLVKNQEQDEIKEAISQMRNIRKHYLSEIDSESVKRVIGLCSKDFINTLEHILLNFIIDIKSISNITHSLNNHFNGSIAMYIEFLGFTGAEDILKGREVKQQEFLIAIEEILTSGPNHYKQKIINTSFLFLKEYLQFARNFNL